MRPKTLSVEARSNLVIRGMVFEHAANCINTSGASISSSRASADRNARSGHDGRGGWSWYTGSAARMLWAAYAILGLKIENGELLLPTGIGWGGPEASAPEFAALDININAAMTYDGTKLKVVLTDTNTGKSNTQTYTVDIPTTVGRVSSRP